MDPLKRTTQTSAGRETPEQTLARAQKMLAQMKSSGGSSKSGSSRNSTPRPGSTDRGSEPENALITQLTAALERQGSGISSSSSSRIQKSIGDAIANTERAGESTRMALESEASREVAFAEDRAGAQFNTALEGRTGFATQVVALRELTETTEKSIRDLRGRYNELILQNDSATANRVAELELQKLEFLQQQEQQFFSNMISVAGIAEQQLGRQQSTKQFWANFDAEEDRFTRGQTFELDRMEKQMFNQERQQMLGIAAEYGVDVNPGDTIETIIKRVSPYVDQKRSLELEEMRASISASRASAARALQGDVSEGLGDIETEALAQQYANGNTGILSFLKDPNQVGRVLDRANKIVQERVTGVNSIAKRVSSQEEFERELAAAGLNPSPEEIENYANIYGNEWRQKQRATRPKGQFPVIPKNSPGLPWTWNQVQT